MYKGKKVAVTLNIGSARCKGKCRFCAYVVKS